MIEIKITFIRPFTTGHGYEPPLGIAYLAAYIRKHMKNAKISIIDCEALNLKLKDIKKELEKTKPDIVGISIISYDRFEGLKIAKIAKKLNAKIMVGGPHTTFIDKETLRKNLDIDVIIRGEGEETTLEYLKAIESKKKLSDIKGITYRNKNKIIRNPDREFIKDINTIPSPAWDLLPMDKYEYYGVFASRGCPYNCTFCASPLIWKRKLRTRNIKDVIDEIEILLKFNENKTIHIKDDTLTTRKKWAIELCNEIIKRKLKFKWECMGRVDTIDMEILKKLKDAGCCTIEYGVETGNEKIMKIINKNITKEQVKNAIKLTKKANIKVGTFFMLGLPEETLDSLEETISFAIELNPDTTTFTPCDLFPGTAIYDEAKKSGYLQNYTWQKNYRNLSGKPVPRLVNKNISEELIMDKTKEFYIRYDIHKLLNIKRCQLNTILNKHTTYHFIPHRKKEIKIITKSVLTAIKKAKITNILRKTPIIAIFIMYLILDLSSRLYKKKYKY